MIEAVRQIVPLVVTVAAVNAQIDALNTDYGTAIEHLPAGGVIDCWDQALLDLPRPSIGYTVGWDKEGVARLQMNQLRKLTVSVAFYLISGAGQTNENALQELGILYEALHRVVDAVPPNGLEQRQLPSVTPVRAIALVNPGAIRSFTLDATAVGKVPGLVAIYDCEVYTATT